MQTAQEHLTSKGIHPSQQRIAIMDFLLKNRIHPTADEIHSALNPSMPTLSKTTIYNTLKLFAEQGAVISLTIDEKNLRYDAYTHSHAHFRCNCCGRVFDLPLKSQLEKAVSVPKEFEVQSEMLYLRGVCENCKNNQ